MTRLILAIICLIWLSFHPVQAEMDHSDYDVPPADLTEEEAAALRERIAAEIAAERARAEAEAQARAEAARREAERLAARSPGERLIDVRCASCHGGASYRETDLGWLGWRLTVWRMDLFNGAGLEHGEHAVIAKWLHAQYPPTRTRAAMEWFVLPLAVIAVIFPLVLWHRRRRFYQRNGR